MRCSNASKSNGSIATYRQGGRAHLDLLPILRLGQQRGGHGTLPVLPLWAVLPRPWCVQVGRAVPVGRMLRLRPVVGASTETVLIVRTAQSTGSTGWACRSGWPQAPPAAGCGCKHRDSIDSRDTFRPSITKPLQDWRASGHENRPGVRSLGKQSMQWGDGLPPSR